MGGIARIAKMFGEINIQGKRHVWDYVADKCVPGSEMPAGSERHKNSERVRWMGKRNALICAARGCDGCSVCKPNESEGRQ